MNDDFTSFEGPLQEHNGQLMVMIPLNLGGDNLVDAAKGIGAVVGDDLRIVVPAWLAAKLALQVGDVVTVDNTDGMLNIAPAHDQ